MSSFKEIVTKAVIGKAKKKNVSTYSLVPNESVNTILGCWVINHSFNGIKGANNTVVVKGSFDINVWYSYDANKKTTVVTENFNYSDTLNVPLKDNYTVTDASDIIVRCLKQPTVSNAKIDNNKIILDVEKEMGIEIVGDTKVKISVEEDDDDYDEIIDEIDPDVIEVNDNYLEENTGN